MRYWASPGGRSNAELFALLQPIADEYWHRRYDGSQGAQSGGMLLFEMLGELNRTVGALAGSDGTRELLADELEGVLSLFTRHVACSARVTWC